MNRPTFHRLLLPATLACLALTACGGGGASGAGAPNLPAIGGLTASGFLAYASQVDGEVQLASGKGAFGYHQMFAIARDAESGAVYGLARSGSAVLLLRVDPTAGEAGLENAPVPIAEVDPAPANLVWHPGEQALFGTLPGTAFLPEQLVRIDPVDGSAEVVGDCAKVNSLTYDSVSQSFLGVGEGELRRIQPASGASQTLFNESAYLPNVRALAMDPLTGLLHGVYHDAFTDPGVVAIDLFGNVDPVAAIDETLIDLELDPLTGSMLGLSDGAALVSVAAGSPAYGVVHRGNVGVEPADFTLKPADGSYYAVDLTNHLVRFELDGRAKTLGRLEVPTFQLVYHAADGVLWGIGNTDPFSSTDSFVFTIDPQTAEQGALVQASVSAGSHTAYDSTNQVLRTISGANDVSLILEPETGDTWLTSNAHALGNVTGLAWNANAGQLLASWWDGTPGETRLSVWSPGVSGAASLDAVLEESVTSLAPLPGGDGFLGLGEFNQPMRITLGAAGTQETLGTVKSLIYRSAALLPGATPSADRIVALANDALWRIDPATGSTDRVGSAPFGSDPTAVTWDSERERLGFLDGDTLRWTGASTPWLSSTQTALNGIDVDALAFSRERGVFYLLGGDGLHSMALNAADAAFVAISSQTAPAPLRDLAWRDGFLWACTCDGHLHRIDPDTGDWQDLGRPGFDLRVLF